MTIIANARKLAVDDINYN